jgi:hypothetical protein
MSVLFKVSPRWRFLVAILLLTAIAAWAFTRTEHIKSQMESAVSSNNAKADLLIDMRISSLQRIKSLGGLSKAKTGNNVQTTGKSIQDDANHYFELAAKLGKLLATAPDTRKDELQMQRQITESAEAAAPVVAKIQQLAQAGQTEEVAKVATNELAKGPVKNWLNAINQMILLENDLAAYASERASNDYEHLRSQVLLMVAGVILLGLVAAWFAFNRVGNDVGKPA